MKNLINKFNVNSISLINNFIIRKFEDIISVIYIYEESDVDKYHLSDMDNLILINCNKIDINLKNINKNIIILNKFKSILEILNDNFKNNLQIQEIIENLIINDFKKLYKYKQSSYNNLLYLFNLYLGYPTYLLDQNLFNLYPKELYNDNDISNYKNIVKIIKENDLDNLDYNKQNLYIKNIKLKDNNIGYLCIFLNNDMNFINDLINELLPYLIISLLEDNHNYFFIKEDKNEFIKSLIFNPHKDKNTIMHRLDYYSNNFIWILEFNKKNPYEQTNYKIFINDILKICKSYFKDNFFFTATNGIITVQKKDIFTDDIIKNKLDHLLRDLNTLIPNMSFKIGISRAYNNLSELNLGYNDAIFSLKIGKKYFNNTVNIYYYDDLIIYHLIINIMENPILKRVYYSYIIKLKEYDSKKNSDLLVTLTSYFNNNSNLKKTSDQLYIHRNTLYKRLKTIEKILNIDLNNSNKKLMIHIAIKIHETISIINTIC